MATLSGTVRDANDNLAERLVRVYRRSTGALVAQTVSNATTGAWSVTVDANVEHFAVAHDATANPNLSYLKLSFNGVGSVGSTPASDDLGVPFLVAGTGSPVISTTEIVSGFGNSLYFNGAHGFYANVSAGSNLTIGTQDFAVRMKLRRLSGGQASPWAFDTRGSGSTSNNYFGLYFSASNTLSFWSAGSSRASGTVELGTTYDVEVSRVSGVSRFFIGGVKQESDYTDTTNYAGYAARPILCSSGYSAGTGTPCAHIDDFEMYVGIGLHTADFTPSTTQHLAGPTGGNNAIVYDKLIGV